MKLLLLFVIETVKLIRLNSYNKCNVRTYKVLISSHLYGFVITLQCHNLKVSFSSIEMRIFKRS